jgi:uncharacterized membrane protein
MQHRREREDCKAMTRGRLEAFSDGVLAIIITIMVLGFQTPKTAELSALRPLLGPFLGYVLSFLYIGIYWNNHHHLFSELLSEVVFLID